MCCTGAHHLVPGLHIFYLISMFISVGPYYRQDNGVSAFSPQLSRSQDVTLPSCPPAWLHTGTAVSPGTDVCSPSHLTSRCNKTRVDRPSSNLYFHRRDLCQESNILTVSSQTTQHQDPVYTIVMFYKAKTRTKARHPHSHYCSCTNDSFLVTSPPNVTTTQDREQALTFQLVSTRTTHLAAT